MTILDKKITTILKKQLLEEVVSIKDCSHGIAQIVKIVKTKKDKYIIKFPHKGNELMIYRENFVCSVLKKNFLPRIILKDKNFLIESFIDGKELNKVKKQGPRFYKELGRAIKEIHAIKMSGFGELQNNGKGKQLTPIKHLEYVLKQNSPLLSKIKSFDKKLLQQTKDFIYKNIHLFDQKNPVLLHFDLIDGNIMVKNNKLAGIIDFGDTSCGPKEYDLAKMYLEKTTKTFSYIVAGYGKNLIDMKKIKYFAILHLLYVIPHFSKIDEKKCDKFIKLLRVLTRC
jgi:thiamine kinase-like enzyme